MWSGLVWRLIVNVAGLYLVAWLFQPKVQVSGVKAAIFAVCLVGVGNALVRPLAAVIKVAAFPLNLLSVGLFGLVVSFLLNALVFFGVGTSGLVAGFKVDGFTPALYATLVLSIINTIGTTLIGSKQR